jgi:hypothetical protein
VRWVETSWQHSHRLSKQSSVSVTFLVSTICTVWLCICSVLFMRRTQQCKPAPGTYFSKTRFAASWRQGQASRLEHKQALNFGPVKVMTGTKHRMLMQHASDIVVHFRWISRRGRALQDTAEGDTSLPTYGSAPKSVRGLKRCVLLYSS